MSLVATFFCNFFLELQKKLFFLIGPCLDVDDIRSIIDRIRNQPTYIRIHNSGSMTNFSGRIVPMYARGSRPNAYKTVAADRNFSKRFKRVCIASHKNSLQCVERSLLPKKVKTSSATDFHYNNIRCKLTRLSFNVQCFVFEYKKSLGPFVARIQYFYLQIRFPS